MHRPHPQAIDSTHSQLADFTGFSSSLDSLQGSISNAIKAGVAQHRATAEMADKWWVGAGLGSGQSVLRLAC